MEVSQYQLILAFNYMKNQRYGYVIYDAALLAVDSYDNYRIVDNTGLKHPLSYPCLLPKKISAAFNHHTFSDLNKKIKNTVTRLAINTVWVYTDGPILRKFWALKENVNVIDLRNSLINGTLVPIAMNSDFSASSSGAAPETTRMIFMAMSNLVAGYSSTDNILYSEKEHVIACDVHRFAIPDDKYLCAATLVTINRLVLLMFQKCHLIKNAHEIDTILKHLLLKLLYPHQTTWNYNPDTQQIETEYGGTLSTEGLVNYFNGYLKALSYVNHVDSDIMGNVMKLLGYNVRVYQHIIYIP